MDKFDRIQHLHRIFASRRYPVPLKLLAEKLECSERTVLRSIDRLRDTLGAPIEYDEASRGWHYSDEPGDRFELPGLWLTADELQSLSVLLNLLESLGSGLLNDEIAVIEKEVHKLLQARGISAATFAENIRVLPIGHRQLPGRVFNKLSEALLDRRRVAIHYTDFNGAVSDREISPQTLVYYRDNWMLDAWCHRRDALRTFSVARIGRAEILDTPRFALEREELVRHFSGGYGIFAGKADHTARLRFHPAIAREIALQQWHPHQRGEWDGADYLLTIPYADDRELVQDILRHSPHVVVETPDVLRHTVRARLQQALDKHD